MARRKRFIIVVILFTSLIIMRFYNCRLFSAGPRDIQNAAAGQKQPVERQPFQNRFQWQAGLEVIADLSADKLTYTGVCPTSCYL